MTSVRTRSTLAALYHFRIEMFAELVIKFVIPKPPIMPWSHHSHSGQFCGHAVDTLEEVVKTAIQKGMTTFCLTEHLPREQVDFYPEEIDVHTESTLAKLYDDFYHEARRLQSKYIDKIQLFVGFESEWIRSSSRTIIEQVTNKYPVDMFIGSLHHVHTVPIDFDTSTYERARELAGGSDEQLFNDYFDSQFEMLNALNPPIVGHFDLIRLKSADPNRSFRDWDDVWSKVIRNLKYVISYGGVLELNSSALRKGLKEPYPQSDICKEFVQMGGRFTLSDDSHGMSQVGLNYVRVLEYAKQNGISDLYHVVPGQSATDTSKDSKGPSVCWGVTTMESLTKHGFWTQHVVTT